MVQYPFTKKSSESIQSALKNEGMVCFPTETIYGLGGNALSLKVVEKIFALKKRPLEKSLSVLVDQEWLGKLAYWEDDKIDRIIEDFWPGPLTLVLPARRELPEFLKGPNQTIALRWSSSSVVQEMIKLGECPLIGTSANLSGMPSCSSSAEVVEQFGDQTPLLVDSGVLPENPPTTLLDCTRTPFSFIRSGSIDQKILEDYI